MFMPYILIFCRASDNFLMSYNEYKEFIIISISEI